MASRNEKRNGTERTRDTSARIPREVSAVPEETRRESAPVAKPDDKLDKILEAVTSQGKKLDAQEERLTKSVKEIRDTIGVLSDNDSKQRRDIDANRKDINELKRKFAELRGETPEETEAKAETEAAAEEEAPKPAVMAKPARAKEEPASEPERIVIPPEAAKKIPGVPNEGVSIGRIYRYAHVVDLETGETLYGATTDVFAAKRLDPLYKPDFGFFDKEGRFVRPLTTNEVHRFVNLHR